MTISYKCPACELENDLEFTPFRAGRSHGHPDTWTPDEGGDIDPMWCEECGHEFDINEVAKSIEP